MCLLAYFVLAIFLLATITASCPPNLEHQNTTVHEFQIFDGVYIAETPRTTTTNNIQQHRSFIERVLDYFQHYEIRFRISDLINGQTQAATGRKKDKGIGILFAVGTMLGKFLLAAGFGSVGLLALKALMVSSIALLLSVILGLKKLVSSHDDHHHGLSDEHRKRRRRDIDDLVYSAWKYTY